MRKLADRANVKQPVIYYYFENKEALLTEAFYFAQGQLRDELAALPPETDARRLLRQRLAFSWENAHLVMVMLNYFLGQKREVEPLFQRVPPAAYRHIQQAIELGITQGVYASEQPGRDAAMIVHAMNGFAMEHFPGRPHQSDPQLLDDVVSFIERALRPSSPSFKGTSRHV